MGPAAMRFAGVMLTLTLAVAAGGSTAFAQASSQVAAGAAAITGRITDARNLPIVGAVITARGTTIGWTATLHDGSFRLSLPAGSYDFLVRKGGYNSSSASVLLSPGSVKTIALSLGEANLSSVTIGSAKAGLGAAFNAGVSATTTLSGAAMSERPAPNVNDVGLELSGVTLAHAAENDPNTSFVVRGGTDETRVQIDGHAVSAGATGRWNTSNAAMPVFDSIEVVKGAGVSGANAGESVFGTINLRTRDFAPGHQVDAATGVDSFGGSYSSFALSGNAFQNDRLSYVFSHSVNGYNGPQAGKTVDNVVELGQGKALLADRNRLDSPFLSGSDLAKLRWRFSGATSLTAGFIDMHSTYAETGGVFGEFLGEQTIVPAAPGQLGGTDYSSPEYPGLIGKTVPAYTFAHNTSVETNQPLFEAELRTAIRNDTLLVRPYVATIDNRTDGVGRADGADPSAGGAWTRVTTGTGCSVEAPCFVPASPVVGYRSQEVDRLHGITVVLIHPLGAAMLNLSYDYHSDETDVSSGYPILKFNGTINSLGAYLPIIPTTLASNSDLSATYTVPLTRRLQFFVGEYYTDWNLKYGKIVNTFDFAADAAHQVLSQGLRDYRHDDPHLGFTWLPQSDTALRFTAGSAISVPYAELVAGGPGNSGSLSGQGVNSERNPALQPESTIAYDFGVDHRLRSDTVVALDVFDNTIHNVFATQVTPFDPASLDIPLGSPLDTIFATTTKPVNAPLERNYGIELTLTRAPLRGLGYRLATTVQRAYLDQLPASFFVAPSTLINGQQLDGSTSIPYTHAYGELNFRNRSGIAASLGADYTGANNWTNGPAFLIASTMLRYDLRGRYRAQFSIGNLFDHSTGTALASGVGEGGFATPNYGVQTGGAFPSYGASPTTRFAIAPRTFRLGLETHIGH